MKVKDYLNNEFNRLETYTSKRKDLIKSRYLTKTKLREMGKTCESLLMMANICNLLTREEYLGLADRLRRWHKETSYDL